MLFVSLPGHKNGHSFLVGQDINDLILTFLQEGLTFFSQDVISAGKPAAIFFYQLQNLFIIFQLYNITKGQILFRYIYFL